MLTRLFGEVLSLNGIPTCLVVKEVRTTLDAMCVWEEMGLKTKCLRLIIPQLTSCKPVSGDTVRRHLSGSRPSVLRKIKELRKILA